MRSYGPAGENDFKLKTKPVPTNGFLIIKNLTNSKYSAKIIIVSVSRVIAPAKSLRDRGGGKSELLPRVARKSEVGLKW